MNWTIYNDPTQDKNLFEEMAANLLYHDTLLREHKMLSGARNPESPLLQTDSEFTGSAVHEAIMPRWSARPESLQSYFGSDLKEPMGLLAISRLLSRQTHWNLPKAMRMGHYSVGKAPHLIQTSPAVQDFLKGETFVLAFNGTPDYSLNLRGGMQEVFTEGLRLGETRTVEQTVLQHDGETLKELKQVPYLHQCYPDNIEHWAITQELYKNAWIELNIELKGGIPVGIGHANLGNLTIRGLHLHEAEDYFPVSTERSLNELNHMVLNDFEKSVYAMLNIESFETWERHTKSALWSTEVGAMVGGSTANCTVTQKDDSEHHLGQGKVGGCDRIAHQPFILWLLLHNITSLEAGMELGLNQNLESDLLDKILADHACLNRVFGQHQEYIKSLLGEGDPNGKCGDHVAETSTEEVIGMIGNISRHGLFQKRIVPEYLNVLLNGGVMQNKRQKLLGWTLYATQPVVSAKGETFHIPVIVHGIRPDSNAGIFQTVAERWKYADGYHDVLYGIATNIINNLMVAKRDKRVENVASSVTPPRPSTKPQKRKKRGSRTPSVSVLRIDFKSLEEVATEKEKKEKAERSEEGSPRAPQIPHNRKSLPARRWTLEENVLPHDEWLDMKPNKSGAKILVLVWREVNGGKPIAVNGGVEEPTIKRSKISQWRNKNSKNGKNIT